MICVALEDPRLNRFSINRHCFLFYVSLSSWDSFSNSSPRTCSFWQWHCPVSSAALNAVKVYMCPIQGPCSARKMRAVAFIVELAWNAVSLVRAAKPRRNSRAIARRAIFSTAGRILSPISGRRSARAHLRLTRRDGSTPYASTPRFKV